MAKKNRFMDLSYRLLHRKLPENSKDKEIKEGGQHMMSFRFGSVRCYSI